MHERSRISIIWMQNRRRRRLPPGFSMSAMLILVLLFSSAAPSWAAALPLEGFDSYVQKSLQTWQVPGAAISVVQDGEVVFRQGFGVRELGKAAPVDTNTIFAIGSASKAFTATALAMLVDQGKIGWDSPVTEVLPGFRLADPWVNRHISLRDMLSHRTGFKGADILWIWQEGFLSRDQIVSRLQYEKMAFPFRSQWHYNNLMYLAAGQVIPALTGMSWDAYIQAKILQPLGMKDSNTSVKQLVGQSDVACPHLRQDGKVVPIKYRNVDMIAAAGAINSNIIDMTEWLEFQLADCTWQGKALLKPATVLQMRAPQISMPIPYPCPSLPGAHFLGYGLAWFLQDYHGLKVVHHGGNIDGMTALVALVPEKKFGVVILSNLDTTKLRDVLLYNLLDRLTGRKPQDWNPHFLALDEKSKQAVQEGIDQKIKARHLHTKPTFPLTAYCGEYHHDFYGKITIRTVQNSLFYKYQGREVRLSHWHYNSFRRPNWSTEEPGIELVTFNLDSDGVIDSMSDDSMARFIKVKAVR
ncbi:MAG: serine hydrolase [Deltaproteobacteria bacterium]|nr:serine hydrolase [Deltaproteobacteria bacterium]